MWVLRPGARKVQMAFKHYVWTSLNITLWLFNIAMENGPFIDDFPIKISIYKGFSMAMLNNQMVIVYRVIGVMIPIPTYSVKIVL